MNKYFVVELLLLIAGTETTLKHFVKAIDTHSAKILAIASERHDEDNIIDVHTYTCEDTEYTIQVITAEEVDDAYEIMCLSKWM